MTRLLKLWKKLKPKIKNIRNLITLTKIASEASKIKIEPDGNIINIAVMSADQMKNALNPMIKERIAEFLRSFESATKFLQERKYAIISEDNDRTEK